MFLKNCLQQWDNVTGATGYDITINEQLLADVESPFLYQNAQPGTEYFVTIRAKNSGGIGLQEELIIIESIRTVHAVARFMLQWQIHFGMAVPKFPDKFADGSLTNNNPFFLHKVLPDIRSGTPFFPGHLHNLDFCVSLKKWGNSNFMPYCILDFFSARNEKYEKIKNQLPLFLRKYNHEKIKAIVMTSGSRMLFFMSFLLGIVISVGEFLCAGQIYLATIAYMIQNQRALTLQAFLYLLIYDIGFVLPMLIITVMIERGRELFDISEVLRKKLPLIKLIFAIAFVLLAVAIIFLS